MKAVLLTAGLGTRLLPLTQTIPKCLIDIAGKPLIDWWFDAMEKAAVTEVLINLHHLPDQVRTHVNGLKTPIKVHFYFEESLLGSAGTLKKNYEFVKDQDCFYIIYADNLTSIKLDDLYQFHKSKTHAFTMALFETNKPSSCGIAALNENGTVIEFVEKPAVPKSNLANAGIYIASPSVIDLIPENKIPADIGFDLLPLLVNKMSGWKTDSYLIDIGTHDNLAKARAEWPNYS